MSQPIRLADQLGASGAPSALTHWFDARLTDAAQGFVSLGERLLPRRGILFVEQADGTLLSPAGACRIEAGRLQFQAAKAEPSLRGAQVEFRLAPQRFVFRELELPARAGEFLDGVVRAQIDRLTPWRAGEACFGCGAPKAAGVDRILVTIAATKRVSLAPLLEVAAEAVLVTTAREDGAAPIAVAAKRARASARQARCRFWLAAALAVSLACGVAALAAQTTLGAALSGQADTLSASLDQRRAALLRRQHASDDPAAQALDARKRASPSAVVVLEALARALPDDAYLTQMRLKGDKVEISGLAADAAGLIKHIEQSPHFSRATFTAPTTRGGEERESFRIEAHVAPLFTVTP
ncbi:MAG: PilN domain-containing protein [Pseudomonadota bacterium]|nr:PilN domain-containing protein [Pseudomonadota bacterium]